MRSIAAAIVILSTLMLAVPADACSLSRSFRENPAPVMAAHAQQIAWARALRPPASPKEGVQFQVIEVLKGELPAIFALQSGRYVTDKTEPWRVLRDANGHRSEDSDQLYIVGSPLGPDCSVQPYFIPGEAYLIFLGPEVPGWAAYERVRSTDDLWLRATREAISASVQR